jgi:predicted nucleic acid-binding protein
VKAISTELIPKDHIDHLLDLDPTPRINLSTSEDIRREMAKVYRETRCNKILPSNGTKLVYMLINILKAYEVTEIEKRLSDLELVHLESSK